MNIAKCGNCCENPEPAIVLPRRKTHQFSKKLSILIKRLQPVVELVCRLALAVFAAILNLKLFAITVGVGAVLGISYALYKNIINEPIEVGLARPSCAQGFFDYLSGVKCPPLVSTVITAVFIGGHMHHSPFYIAFCGVPFGVWLGTQATQITWNLAYRDIYNIPINKIGDVFAPIERQEA